MSTDSMSPSKDTVWQTGLERKIQQSVIYRIPISLTKTNTDLGWNAERRFTSQWTLKTGKIAILISDKVDFKLTLIKQDKGQLTLTKGVIHQKEITIINLYAPNASAPNFFKHTLKDLKAHIDSNTVVVEDFNNSYHQYICQPNKKNQ
jgi:hypothetical protein